MTAVAEDRASAPEVRRLVAPHPADRAALARAVLARAEEQTGTVRWVPRPVPVPGGALGIAPAAAAVPVPAVAPDVVPVAMPVEADPASGVLVLPVTPAVTGLLPSGGLDRGATVVVGGSTALVLALIAEASRSGSWVAMVGLPRVGVLAAHQTGLDLERLVLVPTPGPEGPTVVAALLDGVDVVVVGDVALSDADRRRLSARARERGAVLLSCAPWSGANLVLTVEATSWAGLGKGHGRLRERRLTVACGGRGAAARGWRAEVTLPVGRVRRAVGTLDAPAADTRTLRVLEGRRAG